MFILVKIIIIIILILRTTNVITGIKKANANDNSNNKKFKELILRRHWVGVTRQKHPSGVYEPAHDVRQDLVLSREWNNIDKKYMNENQWN